MNILVDENIPLIDETFAKHGQVTTYAGRTLSSEELIGVDALITRSVTKVNPELLSRDKPNFVGTCTIGTDHLDIDFLESQSIKWASAPGCNAQSVVDYVLSVMASFDRLAKDCANSRNQSGEQNDDQLVVGIIGCGNVGNLLRRRLTKMALTIRVYDPFLASSDIPELCSLDEVFHSDIVCMHTPFTSEGTYPTENMVSKKQLELLPENACLISAGRGGVIVESDLLAFIRNRPDVQIALDVWASEPIITSELLFAVDISTPHVAGYSLEGKCRGTLQVYQQFCECFGLTPYADMNFIETFEPKELLVKGFKTTGEKGPEEEHAGETIVGKEKTNSIREFVLSGYNPKADTEKMRQSYKCATLEEREKGFWFDELRRNYPERRELSSCKTQAKLEPLCRFELEKLGFS